MNNSEILKTVNLVQSEISELKKISSIFPQVKMVMSGNEMIATTLIRKEYEGKWYLWHLIQRGIVVGDMCNKADILNRIMLHAYNIIVLGKVDLNCKHLSGEPMFELDPDQTPEPELLMKVINPKL